MRDKIKKDTKKQGIHDSLPGRGLVFGTAIGTVLGTIINIKMMPVFAGIGCAVGLLVGAIFALYKKRTNKNE
jgi:uncharacterized protein YqgC (DUF456 family)